MYAICTTRLFFIPMCIKKLVHSSLSVTKITHYCCFCRTFRIIRLSLLYAKLNCFVSNHSISYPTIKKRALIALILFSNLITKMWVHVIIYASVYTSPASPGLKPRGSHINYEWEYRRDDGSSSESGIRCMCDNI
jgi:hypothetical protein